MQPDWKLLETVNTAEEARLIAGFLASEGVACELESLLFRQEPVALGLLGRVRLHVPAADLSRARRLIAECRADEDPDPPSRRCGDTASGPG